MSSRRNLTESFTLVRATVDSVGSNEVTVTCSGDTAPVLVNNYTSVALANGDTVNVELRPRGGAGVIQKLS